MTLMPVSNICVFDSSWSKVGGLRWIGQRSVISIFSPGSRVEHLADDVEDLALGDVADGHRDRLAGVADLLAADEAVGGLQRDGAHEVVAEVLGDLERDLVVSPPIVMSVLSAL